MALNRARKISELEALTSASLDTTIVGVDNGVTYKIELDVLADSVGDRINVGDRNRLSNLESYTASFISTTDTTQLNAYTASQNSLNTAFTNGINARLQTSSFNDFSASVNTRLIAATNEQNLSGYVTDLVYNVLSQSVDNRIDNLEANSGSYLTSLNGAISSSSQLTSSYDTRYTLSGSISAVPSGTISGSAQITAFGFVSQSTDIADFTFTNETISNNNIVLDANNDITLQTNNGDIIFNPDGNTYIGSANAGNGIVTDGYLAGIIGDTNTVNNSTGHTLTDNLTNIINSIPTIPVGTISGSSQLTSSYDTRYTLSGSVQPLPSNLVSSSAQITTLGFISSSDSTTALNSYTASLKNAIELTGSTVSFLGNIVIYGTQSVINSQNVEISDNILYLSPTASTDNDLGIVGHYNDGTYRHAGIFMDASDGHSWKVFTGLQTETTATVDTNGTGFTLAPFKAGVITGTSFNGIVNATNGVISGSSQLPAGLVSGSSQVLGGSGVVSGSYETTGRGIISSSANLVTTSSFNSYTASISTASLVTSITNLNTFTASVSTASLVTSISNLNIFSSSINSKTSSYATTGSNSFNGNQTITGSLFVTGLTSISTSFSLPTGSSLLILSGSTIYVDSSGSITGSLSGSIFGIGDVVAFSSSVNSRLNSAGGVAGTISSSAQITAFGFVSGSYETTGRGIISSSANLVTITAFNDYTASISTASLVTSIVNLNNATSSYETMGRGIISGSSQLTSSYDIRYTLSGSISSVPTGTISGSAQITTFGFVSGSYETTGRGIISGSSQLTSSYDTRYILSGSVSAVPSGTISGSAQITAFGFVSSSTSTPAGTISGSAQITEFGFVSGSYETTGRSIVSGSSQLTSSFDSRYVLETETGSLQTSITNLNSTTASLLIETLNLETFSSSVLSRFTTLGTYTSSLNTWTSSIATTGSNSFNGAQTITGSLTVSSVAVISASFTANSSSLTLNSGSNLYIQNNGIAEITGSLLVSGSTISLITPVLQIGTGSGDEGGEILLAKSQTNNSLTGSGVTIDSYQNRLRIFEQGGNARGVFVDLTKAPNGVAGELLWKAGGLVNADVDVTLGNLKARIPSTGNRSLQLSTVSGTYSVYGSGVYSFSGISGTTIASGSPLSITTTPAYIVPSYNFTVAGAADTWTLMDTSAGIAWRITMIIGASYNNNMITIERLV